jgi:heat shock protein HtpX
MSATNFESGARANRHKTAALLSLMFLLLVTLAYLGAWGVGVTSSLLLPLVVLIAVALTWASWWKSDALILRMTKARVVDSDQAPMLHNLVEEMCLASGMPKPRIALMDDPAPNAFATGRDPEHAVIAFTTGILELMDREELQGVTAHELAHVANRDTLVMAVAATTAGAVALLSDLLLRVSYFGGSRSSRGSSGAIALAVLIVGAILAPLAAALIKSAVSRQRETLADHSAVAFTRNPAGLRRALEKLEANTTVVKAQSRSTAHLWIECPLSSTGINRWFSTHPPIRARIAALQQMENGRPLS